MSERLEVVTYDAEGDVLDHFWVQPADGESVRELSATVRQILVATRRCFSRLDER